MSKREVSIILKITTNRGVLLTSKLTALSLFCLGGIFFYLNSTSSYLIYKLTAIIIILLALLLIVVASFFSTKPRILVSYGGLYFDISFLGKPVFIPWESIVKIGVEREDPIDITKHKIVFEIERRFIKQIPSRTIGMSQHGNALYFSNLSMPLEVLVERLLSIKEQCA
jgi:hypothetical protein